MEIGEDRLLPKRTAVKLARTQGELAPRPGLSPRGAVVLSPPGRFTIRCMGVVAQQGIRKE